MYIQWYPAHNILRRLYQPLSFIHYRHIVVLWNAIVEIKFIIGSLRTREEKYMLEVLPKIARMQASYALGKPLALPMNLTISVSYRCNSRCKTCNVWQRPNDDFTLE